jgi:predicted ABC-type ATPase
VAAGLNFASTDCLLMDIGRRYRVVCKLERKPTREDSRGSGEIAKGLSPFQPEKVAFESGRIMLNRIDELLRENESFAFETTLSTKSYKNKIKTAKEKGYTITLLFFWLQNIELAKERVKIRVSEGGHNIEAEIIARRYINGIKNLFNIYLPIVDGVLIFDNSEGKHELIAMKTIDNRLEIIDSSKFEKLKSYDNC